MSNSEALLHGFYLFTTFMLLVFNYREHKKAMDYKALYHKVLKELILINVQLANDKSIKDSKGE